MAATSTDATTALPIRFTMHPPRGLTCPRCGQGRCRPASAKYTRSDEWTLPGCHPYGTGDRYTSTNRADPDARGETPLRPIDVRVAVVLPTRVPALTVAPAQSCRRRTIFNGLLWR